MIGQTDDAESAFERASLMNPDYPYCWIAKAIIYMFQGRPTKAQAAVKGLKLLDGSDSLNLQLARIEHSYPDSNISRALQEALKNVWVLEQISA